MAIENESDDLDLDLDQEASEPESSRDESLDLSSESYSEPVKYAAKPDDDDAQYSTRVRKRIDKEVYRRKAAEEREARLSAELAVLRADIEHVKSRNAAADAQAAEGTLQGKLDAARQRLQQAHEDGDSKTLLEATEELADLKSQQREWVRAQEWQKRQQEQTAQANHPIALPAGTQAWINKNSWFMSGKQPRAARLAQELDAELQAEGYNPTDPAMYAELNKRLRAAMPKASDWLEDPVSIRTRDLGPPTGSSSPDGRNKPPSGSRRQFTRADLEDMRSYQIPDTPENRKVWLSTHPQAPSV